MKLLGLVGLLVAFIGSTFARVPAHLAGTDIFPYEGVSVELKRRKLGADGKTIVEGGRAVLEDVSVELPLGVLNLASGAEFFTVIAQQLYKYADLIEVVADDAVAAGAAAAAAPVRGGRRVHRYIVDPWTKSLKKKEDVNPISILIRALFKQVDGTTGLGDFRVSTLAMHEDGLHATLADWADAIVAVFTMHTVRAERNKIEDQVGVFNKLLSDKNSLIRAYNVFLMQPEKPTFGSVIALSMAWGEAAGFGPDVVLRMLMGGVYALCGHDQKAIKFFYNELLKKLAKQKIFSAAVPAQFTRALAEARARFTGVWGGGAVQDSATRAGVAETKDPEPADGTGLPEAYTADAAVDSPSYTAYQMLENRSGAFSILAYEVAHVGSATYPDCFETTMRNIVRVLVANVSDLDAKMHADYAAYFTEYNTEWLQVTQQARDAWASLVSRIPGILYTENKPELEPSLMNLLVALNYIFQLKLPALDAITDENPVTIKPEGAADRATLLESLVPLVSNALHEKLGKNVVIEVDSYNDVGSYNDVDSHLISIEKFQAGDIVISGRIYVGGHAEVLVPVEDMPKVGIPDANANIFMALEIAANKELARPEALTIERQAAYTFIVTLKPEKDVVKSLIQLPLASALMSTALTAVAQLPHIYQTAALTIELVEKGYGFEFAIAVAEKLLSLGFGNAERFALELYIKLVEKGYAFDQSLEAAEEAIKRTDVEMRSLGMQLVERLVEKGYGYELAAAVALEYAKSVDLFTRDNGLRFLKKLIEKGQGFEEASLIASEFIKSSSFFSAQQGFELIEMLTEKGYASEGAASAAVEAIKSNNFSGRAKGFKLLEFCIERGYGIDQAIEIAVEFIERSESFNLLCKLIEKGHGFDQGIKVAEKLAGSSETSTQVNGLQLIRRLIEKGQAFDLAAVAAREAVKSSHIFVRNHGLFLYCSLVQKGKEIESASAAAAQAVMSSSNLEKRTALKLQQLIDSHKSSGGASTAAGAASAA